MVVLYRCSDGVLVMVLGYWGGVVGPMVLGLCVDGGVVMVCVCVCVCVCADRSHGGQEEVIYGAPRG